MTAFQAITKSTTEHLGATRFNRPPPPAKRHGFSPPFTSIAVGQHDVEDDKIRSRPELFSGFGQRRSSGDDEPCLGRCRHNTSQQVGLVFNNKNP